MDYFKKFNLEESYNIDLQELEKQYLFYQQQYHPDRNINKTSEEKIASLQESMEINEAYKMLKSDLRRAEYLMELRGISMDCKSSKTRLTAEILMEAFEDRQKLDETTSDKSLESLLSKTQAVLNNYKHDFNKSYQEDSLEDAALIAIKMRYKHKFLVEIETKKVRMTN